MGKNRYKLFSGPSQLKFTDEILPYDSEIEYLESTGTQYINTGIVCNIDYTIEIEALVTSYKQEGLFGSRQSSSSNQHCLIFPSDKNQLRYSCSTSDLVLFVDFSLNTWHNVIINYNNLQIDGVSYTYSDATRFTIPHIYYLFAVNTNGSATNFGTKYIRKLKISDTDNNVLIDLIPVRKGNVGYMYDQVSHKLFGNSGTGDFILGPDINGRGGVLPYDTMIEYLESNGTQYILIPFDKSYSIRVDFSINQKIAQERIYGGSGNLQSFYVNRGYALAFARNGDWSQITSFGVNTKYTAYYNSSTRTMTVGSAAVTSNAGDYDETEVALFGAYSDGSFVNGLNGKIYSFRYYNQSSELIMDLVPVRVGNVGYMYDQVNKILYKNLGTGNFILGPDKN